MRANFYGNQVGGLNNSFLYLYRTGDDPLDSAIDEQLPPAEQAALQAQLAGRYCLQLHGNKTLDNSLSQLTYSVHKNDAHGANIHVIEMATDNIDIAHQDVPFDPADPNSIRVPDSVSTWGS